MNMLLSALLLVFSSLISADDISMNVNSKQKQFIVKLLANPTTGYRWTLEHYNKNFLQHSHSEYQKPATKLIGAGGQMWFTFSINKSTKIPKQTELVFKYARPWEPKSAQCTRVIVRFQ